MSRYVISDSDRNWIKQIRLNLGLNQSDFANRIGMKLRAYQYLENGKSKTISEDVFLELRKYDKNELSLQKDKLFVLMERNKISINMLANHSGIKYNKIQKMLKNNMETLNKDMLDLLIDTTIKIIKDGI